MNSGQPPSLLRPVLVFLLLVTTAVTTLLAVDRVASSQQPDKLPGNPSPQGDAARERKIGIGIPKHLPLKFEIRNLNSDRWVYDLEIEVTNTSTKPIYYLDFFITMPGYKSKITGNKLGFWFRYGRIQLVDFAEPVLPDDIPIAPGEKHTFKIPESNAKGWEETSEREGRPEPKVFSLQFQGLNFGDGTGFVTTAGEPVNMHRKVGGAGVLALAEFDKPANGGNQDGSLTSSDAVFLRLRLWQDRNHNGISESNELSSLPDVGLIQLNLNYETSRRTDQFKNRFRYRTQVKDQRNTRLGRWAWDVFLNLAP